MNNLISTKIIWAVALAALPLTAVRAEAAGPAAPSVVIAKAETISDDALVEPDEELDTPAVTGPSVPAKILDHRLADFEDSQLVQSGDDLDLAERCTALGESAANGPVVWTASTSTTPPSFDIPVSDDPRVGMWVDYFQGRGRDRFEVWLSRITRFAPLLWEVLEKKGLPRDLIFLSMIESGFSTRAYSLANAAGPWQFIAPTGRRYGLRVDFWVDDRRDFERSTVAAARYLKALHDEFGDWWLAWAAYNAGEGRVRKAIAATGVRDFWQLAKLKRQFRPETRDYVPKLIAAAMISKQPQRYGFASVDYQAPMDWDILRVNEATDLKTIARACGTVTEDDLKNLNPALYRGVTPPGEVYDLRVPFALRTGCEVGLGLLGENERSTYRYHRVAKGDTLEKLAKKYNTTPEAIIEFNHLENKSHLGAFDALIVPLPMRLAHSVPVEELKADWLAMPPFAPGSTQQVRLHRVRSGETLSKIARQYGVPISRLIHWNGLTPRCHIRAGQSIRIFAGRA